MLTERHSGDADATAITKALSLENVCEMELLVPVVVFNEILSIAKTLFTDMHMPITEDQNGKVGVECANDALILIVMTINIMERAASPYANVG
jgi:hypothetical protein